MEHARHEGSEHDELLPSVPLVSQGSLARRVGYASVPIILIGAMVLARAPSKRGLSAPVLVLEVKEEVASAAKPPRDGKCSGNVSWTGYGQGTQTVQIVTTDRSSPPMASGASVSANRLHGRGYFADTCKDGPYEPSEYVAINPLGKTIRYMVDMSGAGCGCNVAFYLASMRQNTNPSEGGDYYCDANGVGGVNCAEIDIQESNVHAWFTTLHAKDDINGAVIGYGGDKGKPDYRDWTREDYGPGGNCVDTMFPFQVSASFHTVYNARFSGLELTLSQEGKGCSISRSVYNYNLPGRDVMGELTANFEAGMTPVISYWVDRYMYWFDGPGQDGNGPCPAGADNPDACPESVRFYDFSLVDIGQ